MAVTDQDIRALQEELRKLKQTVVSNQNSIVDQQKKQLKYPVDADTQTVINGLIDFRLKTVLYDNMWRRVFRWYEPFDSIDNWDISSLTALGVAPLMGALIVTTDAVMGDQAYAARLLTNFNVINSFDRDSAFRVSFYFKQGPAAATYYLTVGDHLIGARNFYGFKVVNGALYGVISHAGTAAEILTKQLATLTNIDDTNESYLLEARYYAGVKVEFFVTLNIAGTRAKIASVPIAALVSPIDTPAMIDPSDTPYIFSFSAITSDADPKDIYLLDLDYIQRLEIS